MKRKAGERWKSGVVEKNDENELNEEEKNRYHLSGNWRRKNCHCVYNEKESINSLAI